MHISRLLCAPPPEKAATRGTSDDLQLQAIPDASVDKLAVSKITTVPCDSSDSPFRVVEIKESDAQTGTSACYSVLIPEAYHTDSDNGYGDSKSSQEEGSTKTVRCGFCKKRGHYRKTCPVSLASTPVYYPAKAKVDLPTCGVQIEGLSPSRCRQQD
ncbi:hypothetical protein R3P38DRAFT_3190432 [Favolaschia claudopus]|uniref:CCHC-type domain-containing protein n=1 Tax=Favolaschia claudopus TaxID=2862362 RepID=A0AAW0BKE5_9AGAR